MSSRTFVLAVVLSLGALSSGSAQDSTTQGVSRPDDPLKRLLQQQFTPAPAGAPDARKFDWIAPKTPAPARPPSDRNGSLAPNRDGSGSLAYRVAENRLGGARFASDAITTAQVQPTQAPEAPSAATQPAADAPATPPATTGPSTIAPAPTPPPDVAPAAVPTRSIEPARAPAMAPNAVPAIAHNTFVIVLKPNANAEQINSLLQRHRLNVTKVVPGMHLLRVERTGEGDDDDVPPRATSSAPARGKEGLARVLNPPIVQRLRREPIVDSAFVESTLSPRSVPKAKSTTIVNGGVTFNWHWKDGFGGTPGIAPTPAPGPASGSTPAPGNPASTNPAPATGTAPIPVSSTTSAPTASPTSSQDGNWGLKVMRLPAVWTILQRNRVAKPKLAKPKLAILDTGFFPHEDLNFNALRSPNGTSAPNVKALSSVSGNTCDVAHGNHVAGIAGAVWSNQYGIDGAIPNAKIDAVPFTVTYPINSASTDGAGVARDEHLNMFVDIANDLSDYLDDSDDNPDGLRVINMSLGYNFISGGILDGNPEDIPGLSTLIQDEAKQFAHLMKRYENKVLFVVAAGNDSAGRSTPIDAKWSSSIAWAATQTPGDARPRNVLVVEAVDRDGQRAGFSNIGGQVAAPGVNILSTLSTGDSAYGVCSGTSQAAPHVAALATLLFELDPTKKAYEIADIIKSSAFKQLSGPGAPRVDALEAVLKLSPSNLTRLADLNADGKVDLLDMEIFAKHMTALTNNQSKATPFSEDLNGDGVVDGNECSWPQIDLNGSGTASLWNGDAQPVQGAMRTDLQVMQLAWTDKKLSFDKALHQTKLDAAIKAANATTATTSIPAKGCR
jgi:Subtilase family/Dockerin type I domain